MKNCLSGLWAALAMACVLVAGWPSRAKALDYLALRHEAEQRLDGLRTAAERAAQDGLEVSREQATIITAELFLTYIDWDKTHEPELQTAIASWWRAKQDAPRLAKELPDQELQELVQLLAAAQQELSEVVQGTRQRRPSVALDMTALAEQDGYYRQAGRPVFPSSFTWMPDEDRLAQTYGQIGGLYIHLPHIKGEQQPATVDYEPRDDEPLGSIFLGQKPVPDWLVRKYPEITDGAHHYTGFDTDHPVARELWSALLAEVVPRVAGRRVSQGGYLLTNEPHWYTSTEGWAAGPVSALTKVKFRAWLQQRHKSIATLNSLWGTELVSFGDVTIEIPIDTKLRGQPIWYDWCRFNMDRITEWFWYLKTEIRRHDPMAETHIKLIPGMFTRSPRCHGLDFEALSRLQDILGCDAGIATTPHWREPETWPNRYACDWSEQALPLDFFRSVSPNKLVFDSEWHGLSKANIRNRNMSAEYVRAALWLAHLHGTGMNQTWYWGRDADGAPSQRSLSAFYASNLTQPLVMDAYGRTMKELNAFAPEVVALARQPQRVRFFYSEACAIQDPDYMQQVFQAYQALYHCGLPLGFATAGILNKASEAELKRWPVLIVPESKFVTAADRQSLERYLAQGGTLLVDGADSLTRDEYGRPGAALRTGAGRLLPITKADDATLLAHLKDAGLATAVPLRENNAVGQPGCVWRTAQQDDGQLLLIINLGKSEASIDLGVATPCRDLVTGHAQPTSFTLQPFDMKLLHLNQAAAGE